MVAPFWVRMREGRSTLGENPVGRRQLLRAATVAGLVGTATGLPARSSFAESANEETRTFRGRFAQGAPDWAYVPVDVPSGVREIAVRYTYSKPPTPPGVRGNALDIGVFDAGGHDLGDGEGFRGWSGGARDHFTISASDATPGYLPGPIRPGCWQVILGPYTIAPQGMRWRVEVTLRYGEPGPAFQPNPAPERARGRGHAWYRGDMHLHTVHSDGARTPAQLAAGARAAGLDFVVSTEHNTSSASAVWGAHAGEDLLIIDGEEITTRAGHWIAAGLPAGTWIDWRYLPDDRETLARFVDQVHGYGGIAVAAHPYCPYPGCAWRFGYGEVDAVEVWNGPWTLDDEAAVTLWDGMLREGRWLPAVANSDAHDPGQVIGLPQTAVRAAELSTQAVLAAAAQGRSWFAESAEVSLEMTASGGAWQAGVGQRLDCGPGTPVTVRLLVDGAAGCTVRLLTEDGLVHTVGVPASGTVTVSWRTRARDSSWVRAEVRRPQPTETTEDTMVALTNPIFLGRR